MRALFGVVSLLVVLALVGLLAAKQLKTVAPPSTTPGASAAGTPREQVQQIQQQVKDDVARALEQGAASRAEAADR